MTSCERENSELRRRIRELKAAAVQNQEVMRKARQREHRLLACDTLPALFDDLTRYLRASFGVAEAVVVVEDPQHELRHLTCSALAPAALPPPQVHFCERLDEVQRGLEAVRTPSLGPWSEQRHGRLFAHGSGVGSVALLPMVREGRTVGIIALGAASRSRFHRDLGTDFLENLAPVALVALENAANRARLMDGAFTDPLTGLHNRRYFDSRLGEELARARRERRSLACLLLDIDFFKRVNDTYGHLAGDDVLREVAGRVHREVRASDVCARYGGEELVVLLPATRRADALALAERIREVVCGAPILVDAGQAVTVTASIGVSSLLPGEDDTLEDARRTLLGSADRALYQAKADGRDRVCNAA